MVDREKQAARYGGEQASRTVAPLRGDEGMPLAEKELARTNTRQTDDKS